MRIDAIILAAGLSRRMGRNKLLLPFRGKPLLLHALDLALSLPLASVILVSRQETLRGLSLPPGLRVLANPRPEEGQSSSVRLGLDAAAGDGYLFFMADQPLLDKAAVSAVLALADPGTIVVPRHAGRPGNPVFFPALFRDELLATRGDAGGRLVRTRHPEACRYAEVACPDALADIDTPEHYRRLLLRDGSPASPNISTRRPDPPSRPDVPT